MEREFFAAMANGSVTYKGDEVSSGAGAWCAHPSLKGVYLKSLITGEKTEGALSAHVVRIEPNCTLEQHAHQGQWELHEVVGGDGFLEFSGASYPYHMGRMAVIPQGEDHSVTAGDAGLMLLAKFFPALV
ncbi:cupin [Desulfoluna sp.]|uniref:cupin domain-containing protein n=1 Tax=Desulfoluna sp. TaxID=2045199 RepID=UPI002633FA4F|nr:cupin [Desulfoluna sp.]